ncbi:MAG TPA: MmgE/PrpD family protein [Candidatus Marinimicrobia bacterium]|nr:MmgE/PrpD family protein [Candidatus Neomarinimicrobiota bacterium]
MNKSISRQMAEFAVSLKFADLPEQVVNEVKRYMYDSIGCAYGGYHTKDLNIIRDIYIDIGRKSDATVLGFGDKLPAVNATLINSLMVRALDFNDIYWKDDPSHPSDIIPAAWAVGELVNANMKDVIVAIVLAYEFEQRLCLFAKPGVRERKWHHATLTQFVSPIVAGKLLGLTVDEMVHAIGISGCHNHTIGCPTAGKLTMMKNTVDPMAVQSGVFAALMAQKGFSGTEKVFEGKEGFMDAFIGWNAKDESLKPTDMEGRDGVSSWSWDIDALVGGLGDSYKIMECGMKAFPTEALTHTHLSCVLNAMIGNNLEYSDVKEVKVTCFAQAYDILFDPTKYRPESRETADHSLPYCMAVAMVDKKITTDSFSDEKLNDPRIYEVIDKIIGEPSQEFEKMFPAKQPSRVVLTTNDGRMFEEYLEYPKGDPRKPMTMDDLENKFNSLAGDKFDASAKKQLKETIFNCEEMNAVEFMETLNV